MRHRLESQGVGSEQIETIPNWCDDDLIAPLPREGNRLRLAWGLEGKFVIGYSGNLGRAHEYATLLDAAEKLRGDPDIVFLFSGGGHLMLPLKAEVERPGLKQLFQFQPYQEAMGNAGAQSLASWRAAVFAGHIRARPSFVDEDKLLGIEVELTVEPRLSAFHDIRAILLARMGGLFSR
jgi:hypothetical protein